MTIYCPQHGPMTETHRDGRLVDVRCSTCDLRPVDLVQADVLHPWCDPTSNPIEALNDLLRRYDDAEAQLTRPTLARLAGRSVTLTVLDDPTTAPQPIRLQPCGTFHRADDRCPVADPRCFW